MTTPDAPRLLRLPEVLERVGLSEVAWHRMIVAGQAPQPSWEVGPRNKRAHAWTEAEIDEWVRDKMGTAPRLGDGLESKDASRLVKENFWMRTAIYQLMADLRKERRKADAAVKLRKEELKASMREAMSVAPRQRQEEFPVIALTGHGPVSKEDVLSSRMAISAPSACGIYFLLMEDEIVYVGQSTCVHGRLAQHLKEKSFDGWAFIQVPEEHLDIVESFYISRFEPRLNISKPILSMRDLANKAVSAIGSLVVDQAMDQEIAARDHRPGSEKSNPSTPGITDEAFDGCPVVT